jgi:hypothetical protein
VGAPRVGRARDPLRRKGPRPVRHTPPPPAPLLPCPVPCSRLVVASSLPSPPDHARAAAGAAGGAARGAERGRGVRCGAGAQGAVRGHHPQLPRHAQDPRERLRQQGRRLLRPRWPRRPPLPAPACPPGSRAPIPHRRALACGARAVGVTHGDARRGVGRPTRTAQPAATRPPRPASRPCHAPAQGMARDRPRRPPRHGPACRADSDGVIP